MVATSESSTRLRPYLPRLATEWLEDSPEQRWRVVPGSLLFADLSGFTKMSERLAKRGRIGAEEVTDAIGTCFAALLGLAYAEGGSLLKFGGDALLLLFTGPDHAVRAARAVHGMRARLRDVGRLDTSAGRVVLRMSAGIHSGDVHCFLVGESHRELMITGATASTTVAMEGTATAGEIAVSAATAALLPPSVLGAPKGEAILLRRAPAEGPRRPVPIATDSGVALTDLVPRAVREHVLGGGDEPEHRMVTVAFVHFDGTDHLLRERGPAHLADDLHHLVCVAQEAADDSAVTFLGTDIDEDGGKIILVAGAPSAAGRDEERMLHAVRRIADRAGDLPVRIGVNRGHVFAGDVGPPYRRTYTVMGDTVNLAARLMAAAAPGTILATAGVLEQSRTTYALTPRPPFSVKGKAKPVEAAIVGAPEVRRGRQHTLNLPLVDREDALAALDAAAAELATGRGGALELVGASGLGRTRLLYELRDRTGAAGPQLHGDPYAHGIPYRVVSTLLRELLDLPADAPAELAERRLRDAVSAAAPGLLRWLPLLGTPLGLTLPETRESAALAPQHRRARVAAVTAELLVVLLPRGALLTLDDAQWCDDASAEVLAAIAPAAADDGWLFATARDDGAEGLRIGGHGARVVLLLPLGDAAAEAAVRAVTESSPLRPYELAAVVSRAAGSPLFLTELVRAIAAGEDAAHLPASVDALVTAQIDALPPRRRRLLRYVSVLGSEFDAELASIVVRPDLGSPDEDAWDDLAAFLERDDSMLRFRHEVAREAAYEELPYRQRRTLHERAGDAIASALGAHATTEAERLSLHYLHAGRVEDAWHFGCIAADRAKAKYANLEAAELYERALTAARRLPDLDRRALADTWESLGDVRERAGRFEPAGEAYRSARRLVATLGDPVAEAGLLRKQSWIPDRMGRAADTLRWLRRGLRVLDGVPGTAAAAQRARLASFYAAVRLGQGHARDAVKWCETAIADATASGEQDALAHTYLILDHAWMELGQPDRATYGPQALELYEALGDLDGQGAVLNNLGGFAYYASRWDDAVDLYRRARDAYDRSGNVVDLANPIVNVAEVLCDQGRLEEAEAAARDALRLTRASGWTSTTAFALRLLGRIQARAGRLVEAQSAYAEARELYASVGWPGEIEATDAMLAEHALLAGRLDDALGQADGLLRKIDADATTGFEPTLLERVRGVALAHLDECDDARRALDASLAVALDRGIAYEEAVTLDARVALAPRLRDDPAATARAAARRDELVVALGVRTLPPVGPLA